MVLSCVPGQRLGAKKLTHSAVIVNNLNQEPSFEQMSKLADLVTWLLVSHTEGGVISVFDEGQKIQ